MANVDAPTLVTGEPGSGRTLLARALHQTGGRRDEPLVVLACGDMPETLLETELFGCMKGSVVGASSDRAGVLDLAHGGTVLLQDLDEMPLRTQRLLARFIESGEVTRLGAFGGGMPADVRVVGTSAPRGDRRTERGICEELWELFADSTLTMPALRERRDDIPALIDCFAAVHCAALAKPEVIFAPEALQALMEFSWPGNVRELRSVIERLAGNARSLVVVADDLPVGIRPRRTAALRRERERRRAVGEELFVRLITNGESFWSCVYPLFMEREITRTDVRDLVRRGLEVARGNSATLVRLFNMPAADHKRFVGFLRKYDCQLPIESAR